MRLIIQKNYESMSVWTARYIADAIQTHQKHSDRPFVLGLPTGSSPLGTYRELIRLHRQEGLSFSNVITFNMDEYIGLKEDHPQSYHYFMQEHLFSHIDIRKENVHLPDGNAGDIPAMCAAYEEAIAAAGGIDLFLGGVGVDGHIAFNEPFSSLESLTRVKTLTQDTKIANARFFDGDTSLVPSHAVTVGVRTIRDAAEVVILINGYNKARALHAAVEGPVTHTNTCSVLQLHPKAVIVCDEEATVELKVGTYRYFKDIEQDEIFS